MKQDNDRTLLILSLVGIVPVVWLGLLITPLLEDGLIGVITGFTEVMARPFHIELCMDSLYVVLVLLMIYGISIGVYLSTRRTYRRGEEHGSAKWGNVHTICKTYRSADEFENSCRRTRRSLYWTARASFSATREISLRQRDMRYGCLTY